MSSIEKMTDTKDESISNGSKSKIIIIFSIIATIIIFALWVIMHIYKINEVPAGLHIDEAGSAYDAFCLLNWGVDRYLNPYPLYFYNIGGGQSAMYIYLCALSIKLFDMTTLAFRMPAIVFSFITLIFSSLIVRKAYGNRWMFVNAFLFCILPYFTMQSRFGLDCNLMLGAATFSIWLTIKAIEEDKIWLCIMMGISWGISMYTYVLSYIVFPVFLLMLGVWLLLYRRKHKKTADTDSCVDKTIGFLNVKKILAILVPMIIIVVPLIVMVIINVFDLETISTKFFTIYKLQNDRAAELCLLSIPVNIINVLKTIFTVDSAPFDALKGFYTMYIISIPLFIAGVCYGIYSLKSKLSSKTLIIRIMFMYFLAQLFVGSLRQDVAIYRLNGIYITILFFVVTGIYGICFAIKAFFEKNVEKTTMAIALIIIFSIYIFNFAKFSDYYFNKYPETIDSHYLFSPRLSDVLVDYGLKIETYETYMDAYHLYYMIEKRVNPYEVGFDYEELNQHKTITFNSMTTGIPEDISRYNVYVLNRWNTAAIELLSQYNYDVYWTDDYAIFYNK